MALVRRRANLPVARAAALGRAMGYLAKGASRAYKRRRTGNPPKNESAFADSTPLTGQFDYKTDYRKRRIGRRRRRIIKRKRKWRRKVVNTVRNADVGSTQILRKSAGYLAPNADNSDACSFGLYGQNGTVTDGLNSCSDIREIFREISETDWSAALNNSESQHHKIYAMHATMEMTVRNNGTNDAILEAYFIRGTRPTHSGDVNPTQMYADSFAKEALASDPNTGNTFDSKPNFKTIGITPFQAPWFCRHYKIYKRQKFRLPPGNEVSFIMHDRKPRTFIMDQSRTRATDKNFHGVLFQQQGPPNYNDSNSQQALPSQLTYLSIRRYRIKMFRDNLPKIALDASGS